LLSAQQADARAAYTLVSVANTRSMRNSLRAGYEATGLARLRIAHDDAIDWPEVLGTFDRAGYGSACRAWLMTAQRLPGQAPPAGLRAQPRRASHAGGAAPKSDRRGSWQSANPMAITAR
jgi:hypothetical protein